MIKALAESTWNYERYCSLNDEKRYEIIGGHLLMVPVPNTEHQDISGNLNLILANYVKINSLGKVYAAPIDVVLDDNNIVQPDLLFIKNDNKNIIRKKGIFGSPDLVIEILSPSSKSRDRYNKKELYETFKIKEYWIVDPGMKSIEVLILNSNDRYELYSEGYLAEDNEKVGERIIKSIVLNNLEVKLEDVFE